MKTGYFAVILLLLLVFGTCMPATGAGGVANYTITATNSSYGTISPSGLVEVAPGTNQTFVMTPDPSQLNCWGGGKRYLVWNYTVDGVDSGWLESFDPVEYSFTAVDANHTIHAEFSYGFFDVAIYAEFAANTTSGPVPLTVNFTQVHVSDNTGILWSFGDNTTSTEQNPVHTYTSAGDYEVMFTIFCNNQSFSDLPLGITVIGPPVANFTVNRTFGSPPMTVQFTDTSTGTPPLNYTWDFGDAAISHEQNPVHTYTASGSYQVNLTVSNSAGDDITSGHEPIRVLGPIGGDKGYFLVHCNVDGARVSLDDVFMGVIENGTLRIQVYTTATPFYTYTVEKDGYETFSASLTQYPGKDQTVELYAYLTPDTGPVGTLYVASYPPGATILINGTDYGTTNTFVSGVHAGIRNLTLTKSGYQPYTTTVSVPVNGTKILTPITLTKGGPSPDSSGNLYVASTPSGATILIDGVDYGTTNTFVSDVPAGLQNLTLNKEGYLPKTISVDVPAGGTKVLAPVTLTKGGPSPDSSGNLYVASTPTGATILINGTDFGTTNQFVQNVPAGVQDLTLIKEGYQPYTTTVSVPAGGTKILVPVTLTKGGSGVGEVENLQAALDAAAEGDTIVLKRGTYYENVVINKSVTLIGFGPGITIISGDTGGEVVKGGVINITKPLFHSSGHNVTLIGMTVTGGDAHYGGGIFNDGGSLDLSWISIEDNSASLSGGGIYSMAGTVIMDGNTTVTRNTAPVAGGMVNDDSTLTMNSGSSIAGNMAQVGGGLENVQGTVIMNEGSSITNNSATYDGGGIYSYFYSTINLNGGSITGNTAETGTGGGIYTDSSSTVNLDSGTVSGNSPDDVSYQFDVAYEGTVVGNMSINTEAWTYVLTVDGLTPDTEYWLACEGRAGLIASATTTATGDLHLQGVLNPAPSLGTGSSIFFVGTGSPPPASGTVELDGKECSGSYFTTTIFGTLSSDGAPLSGQEVEFYVYDPVTLELSYPSFGSDTTDSDGTFCKVFFGGHIGEDLAVGYGGQFDMNVEKSSTCPICK